MKEELARRLFTAPVNTHNTSSCKDLSNSLLFSQGLILLIPQLVIQILSPPPARYLQISQTSSKTEQIAP